MSGEPVFGPRGDEADARSFELDDEPTVDDSASKWADAERGMGLHAGGVANAFDIADEPTPRSEHSPLVYFGSNDALARVEALPDGTIVASGSSLDHAAVVIEPRDEDDVSPREDALVPLFRKLVLALGPAALLRVMGKADRQNERAGLKRELRLVRREG